MIGVEAGGRSSRLGDHAATVAGGRPECCTAFSPFSG
jgi:hypothetical protein